VTFDVGFGDIRAYPPAGHHGIIVLRLRDQQPRLIDLASYGAGKRPTALRRTH
jgi:hypothetical protein